LVASQDQGALLVPPVLSSFGHAIFQRAH